LFAAEVGLEHAWSLGLKKIMWTGLFGSCWGFNQSRQSWASLVAWNYYAY
jgi:hypothetical protein